MSAHLRLVSTSKHPIDDGCLDELRKRGIAMTVSNYVVAEGLDWPLEGEHAAYVDQLVELGALVEDQPQARRRRR
ncbi:hypothetical protein [Zeimonas arvi]|uniref:Uncharacterized protein n=1 Tax=Zeimonas arvi TaxID=2498847 RepID=A0A5C8NRU9_9BURK|nr:hypothetical protein [Zeimonas arvi]TXL63906.1 hypothetical protein FHP08_16575 [Zeimonas arvi]